MVCESAFNYQLNAVNGSEEGKKLHSCLSSMVASQAGKGIYANLSERKVSPEELKEAQSIWRTFLTKLLAVIRSDSELFRAKNGALDIEKNFGHALIQLSVTEDTYGDAQLISEIHQVRKQNNGKRSNLKPFFYSFPSIAREHQYCHSVTCYVSATLLIVILIRFKVLISEIFSP